MFDWVLLIFDVYDLNITHTAVDAAIGTSINPEWKGFCWLYCGLFPFGFPGFLKLLLEGHDWQNFLYNPQVYWNGLKPSMISIYNLKNTYLWL